ncbi:MAG TPA: hypothetical protein VFX80_07030 [Solirubrobacteraceae bacterium]|nr:hypothetical protein [Solirubrobacteraceae bacterium]
MTARTLVLGDWTPWIRDPIDVVRVLLAVAALAFLATGDSNGAVLLGGAAALAWAVRPLQLPRVYDACFITALALQAGGEAVGAYDSIPWFDNVAHFTLPFFLAPTLYIALARADVVPDPKDDTETRHYVGIFVITLSLGVALGGIWEIWEWVSDRSFGSSLQLGNDDTVGDLVADTAGSACGAALLVLWARYGWGSVRRIPGENRFEDTEA